MNDLTKSPNMPPTKSPTMPPTRFIGCDVARAQL
jgi:hypothetical protein